MIQLHSDSIIFKTAAGELVPCTIDALTVELTGGATNLLDPETIRHATTAVLHYFKTELGRDCVTVPEFTEALARVLRLFGLSVQPETPSAEPKGVEDALARLDLGHLAPQRGQELELAFFPLVREELKRRLHRDPQRVELTGLRQCVKRLTGARRWGLRCQQLSDQIVDYVRRCLVMEGGERNCALVIR